MGRGWEGLQNNGEKTGGREGEEVDTDGYGDGDDDGDRDPKEGGGGRGGGERKGWEVMGLGQEGSGGAAEWREVGDKRVEGLQSDGNWAQGLRSGGKWTAQGRWKGCRAMSRVQEGVERDAKRCGQEGSGQPAN